MQFGCIHYGVCFKLPKELHAYLGDWPTVLPILPLRQKSAIPHHITISSQFSQQNLSMCAVWRKSRSFTQGEFSHFPSSHFVQFICAQCGGSGEVGAPGWLSNDCQATQTTGFPGPFRIPSNNFVLTFYPPSFLLYILNIKSKHLATKVSQDGILLWFKQWPKGLPGRRRLQHHQVAIYMCHILYVFAYVTLIKSTHSLTHIIYDQQLFPCPCFEILTWPKSQFHKSFLDHF